MIVVRIYGGLGNQLFQYATARRLSAKHGSELVLDTGWFDNVRQTVHSRPVRRYEILRYPIKARLMNESESRLAKYYTGRIWRRIPLARQWRLYREKHFHFDPEVLRLSDDVYLDGYWQCPWYFEEISELLKIELIPSEAPSEHGASIEQMINETNSVAIHVRRGDYVTLPSAARTHGTCTLEYYHAAIDLISDKVDSPHFFVFSDDPDWAIANLRIGSPTVYLRDNIGESAVRDLRLMALCRHQVIANSSFSWWGAWLNRNVRKIVIAPKRWFLVNHDTSTLIPETWIRL